MNTKETQRILNELLEMRDKIDARYSKKLNPKSAKEALELERYKDIILDEYERVVQPINNSIKDIIIKNPLLFINREQL